MGVPRLVLQDKVGPNGTWVENRAGLRATAFTTRGARALARGILHVRKPCALSMTAQGETSRMGCGSVKPPRARCVLKKAETRREGGGAHDIGNAQELKVVVNQFAQPSHAGTQEAHNLRHHPSHTCISARSLGMLHEWMSNNYAREERTLERCFAGDETAC